MRTGILFIFYVLQASGADPEAIYREAAALMKSADQAAASGQSKIAEEGYKAAIRKCDLLPPELYHCKTDGLWKLARVYSARRDLANAELFYKDRLAILLAHQETSGRPDLDIGIALFDLQSVIETNPARDAEAQGYVERARSFYEQCKVRFPDLRKTCDRRLADVEGIRGAVLTLRNRYDQAMPFLKAVTDRPDSGVRTEVMIGALNSYAAILIARGQSSEAQKLVDRVKRLGAKR